MRRAPQPGGPGEADRGAALARSVGSVPGESCDCGDCRGPCRVCAFRRSYLGTDQAGGPREAQDLRHESAPEEGDHPQTGLHDARLFRHRALSLRRRGADHRQGFPRCGGERAARPPRFPWPDLLGRRDLRRQPRPPASAERVQRPEARHDRGVLPRPWRHARARRPAPAAGGGPDFARRRQRRAGGAPVRPGRRGLQCRQILGARQVPVVHGGDGPAARQALWRHACGAPLRQDADRLRRLQRRLSAGGLRHPERRHRQARARGAAARCALRRSRQVHQLDPAPPFRSVRQRLHPPYRRTQRRPAEGAEGPQHPVRDGDQEAAAAGHARLRADGA